MLKELIKEKDITNKLQELGNTPDAVAASLQEIGIKGIKKKSCHCPIANYISALTGKQCAVNSVVILLVEGFESEPINNGAVSGFITNFDQGKYTFLEKASK
jgi:hypothetical protein